MRKDLQPLNEKRLRFTGIFVRYGTKHGWKGATLTTILLKNITDISGKQVTDHLWFNLTMEFMKIESQLNQGAVIGFDARVKQYTKGYKGCRDDVYDKLVEVDYRLSHPTNIQIIKAAVPEQKKQIIAPLKRLEQKMLVEY